MQLGLADLETSPWRCRMQQLEQCLFDRFGAEDAVGMNENIRQIL